MKIRFLTLTFFVLAAVATRLLPHPYNFAPITGVALFGGAHFSKKWQAFFVPLIAMALSDLVLGFHETIGYTYLSFALIVLIGFALKGRPSVGRVAGATLASSLLFFVVTNFGVWASQSLYPKTMEGLVACYVAAIPFLHNTLAGDGCYALALFGGFALAEKYLPQLRQPALAM